MIACKRSKHTYRFRCSDLDRQDLVDHLHDMVEKARQITFRTFAKHCDWRPFAISHGYQTGKGKDLRLQNDWAVNFFRSTWRGQVCYYIVWSAYECVFLKDGAVVLDEDSKGE